MKRKLSLVSACDRSKNDSEVFIRVIRINYIAGVMKKGVQLITYVDRIGCQNIAELHDFVKSKLNGAISGIHILPFYYPIDGEDAGFDPIDHLQVDSRLGTWDDIKDLSSSVGVMADMIVNHVSALSPQFKDYMQKGEESDFAPMFLSYDKVFKNGATEEELVQIYRPRPGFSFTPMRINGSQNKKLIWTTFTQNQVDIDVHSEAGQQYLENILDTFQKAGVAMIRLDAAGYAVKKRGTSCFMIEETFEFIAALAKKAHNRKMDVLVEIHSYYKTQIEIAKRVGYVYDFALPVLVLDVIYNQRAENLLKWLEVSPRNAFTVLDTHDGIGVIDVASENGKPGLIPDNDLDQIVEEIHVRSKGKSRKATGVAASNLDLYQVNCTYFEALGSDAYSYLIARAIQFFCPGIPQVYYVGLFGDENDMELLSKTNVGRDINRHYYTHEEVERKLKSPIVRKLLELMTLRNTHASFHGEFDMSASSSSRLILSWANGSSVSRLDLNLDDWSVEIQYANEENVGTIHFDEFLIEA